jgi:histidine kinase
MKLFIDKATPVQLQWLVWGFVFVMNFLSYVAADGPKEAIYYTISNTLFYLIIIYGNINVLYPRYYQKKQITRYIILTAIFLLGIGTLRGCLNQYMANTLLSSPTMPPQPISYRAIIYTTLAGFVVYILSFVFRIALAYFTLKQQAERIMEQKSVAELNLLKSQVQPHFLFNTLNNIYYEAFRESPRTALLIGRLSEIMRYFVDESPKEKVALASEIQFLENYIALEKIRIRHGVRVIFIKEIECEHKIPPMLLMTFVENIFKHGIDRSGNENKIVLSLVERDGYLLFQTENPYFHRPANPLKEGFGIKNLQKRLTLLYGNDFDLTVGKSDQFFSAFLKIPLV